jgi:hypothetical protein
VYGAGFEPRRCTDPAGAFTGWCRDGASILTIGRTAPEDLLAGATAVFGEQLGDARPLGQVDTNADRSVQGFDFARRVLLSDADNPLEVHHDGGSGFGDVYPDLLFLLCARPAADGGESVLVDGQYLVDAVSRDPAQHELARFLWSVPVEQCVPPGSEISGVPVTVRSLRPVATRTAGGRVTVRYNETQRLEDGAPADPAAARLLVEWRELVISEAAAAPRFKLAPGELLCIDNYRVFHGREPYAGAERLFQRMHAFSPMSFKSQPELSRAAGLSLSRPFWRWKDGR